jgi:hypothetical protein
VPNCSIVIDMNYTQNVRNAKSAIKKKRAWEGRCMNASVTMKANQILQQMKRDDRLSRYVDATLPIPEPYCGTGEIKLIVLGQDPTVKSVQDRQKIRTVLNLDKRGSVYAYLASVCMDLGLQIAQNIYATNLYKSFFVRPPTQISEIDVFGTFIDYWLPLLHDELATFGGTPVLTLGEPILAPLLHAGVPAKVREYWGYAPEWRSGKTNPFEYVRADDNRLDRALFPYPHQPSLRKVFYRERLRDYTAFVRGIILADCRPR